jgi:hypothetical protein
MSLFSDLKILYHLALNRVRQGSCRADGNFYAGQAGRTTSASGF